MTIGIDIRLIGKKQTGSEGVFFNIVKELAKIDSHNKFKLFTDITDEKILEKIKKDLEIENKNNFEIVSLPTTNKFSWNFWTLQRYLRKNPVNVYLTQYITPFFVPQKIKIATIIHDISFNFFPQFIKKSDLFFLKILIPLTLRRADKVLAVSKFTRYEIGKYYNTDPDKMEWFHNAVSEDFLKADISLEKIKEVKEKYNLPDKFILYVGTLQPRKNIPVLIEAYNMAKDKLPDTKLVIAGGKGHNYDPRIDETVKKYNLEKDVFLPGFIDEEDKAAVMAGALIFSFPSLYEGFGIPILEAMSVGVPVIASGILPHREIAEEAVLFFDPENSEELSQKIILLSKDDNLREKLAKDGKRQVKNFSWDRSTQKVLAVLEKMNR
ncbi:MAG TPA: glycosyltransferase family 1 protein [Candidatus Moranbacteria bacterium]|nr:glycosyltransferase family 1 protein [Candidatus Moranbacteria bacterium]